MPTSLDSTRLSASSTSLSSMPRSTSAGTTSSMNSESSFSEYMSQGYAETPKPIAPLRQVQQLTRALHTRTTSLDSALAELRAEHTMAKQLEHALQELEQTKAQQLLMQAQLKMLLERSKSTDTNLENTESEQMNQDFAYGFQAVNNFSLALGIAEGGRIANNWLELTGKIFGNIDLMLKLLPNMNTSQKVFCIASATTMLAGATAVIGGVVSSFVVGLSVAAPYIAAGYAVAAIGAFAASRFLKRFSEEEIRRAGTELTKLGRTLKMVGVALALPVTLPVIALDKVLNWMFTDYKTSHSGSTTEALESDEDEHHSLLHGHSQHHHQGAHIHHQVSVT